MSFPKIAIAIAAYFLIFLGGFLTGGAFGFYALHAKQFSTDSSSPEYERASLEVALQSKDEMARIQALNAHLQFLDRPAEVVSTEESSYAVSDRALTLARLSSSWRRIGDESKSTGFLEKAVSYCPGMKWRHCDARELLLDADRLDRRSSADASARK